MSHIPYFPFSLEQPKIQMGIKPLEIKNWIEIDDNFLKHNALKKTLFAHHADLVVMADSSVAASCLELYEWLQKFLLETHPDKYSIEDGKFFVHATQESFSRTHTDAVESL